MKNVIEPTVGRVVWFWETGSENQPRAALIAYVHSRTLVNLAAFTPTGVCESKTSVRLIQEGDERPRSYFAEWMPYQKGQAAKTEALEAAQKVTKMLNEE